MDREELLAAIRYSPVVIRMNDGSEFAVENVEQAMVTDVAAYVTIISESDGKRRAAILPLVTMSGVFPVDAAS